jgi:hypothetical protein
MEILQEKNEIINIDEKIYRVYHLFNLIKMSKNRLIYVYLSNTNSIEAGEPTRITICNSLG